MEREKKTWKKKSSLSPQSNSGDSKSKVPTNDDPTSGTNASRASLTPNRDLESTSGA